MLKDFKLNILSVFRELLVHNHRSLEFRAKFFAAMICANTNVNEDIYDDLRKIAKEIYGTDEGRVEVLLRTTQEYVKKVSTNNGLNLDELIFDIDRMIKNKPRYISKINLNHLRRLQNQENEDVNLLQQRIIEFAEFRIMQNSTKPVRRKFLRR